MKKSHKKNKVSIIIAILNSGKLLQNTLNSIYKQTYKNIEIIIIDGASKDKTLSVIENNQNKIFYWVSEKDNGISDAFNKGLNISTGEYVYFLGAGDYLFGDTVIEDMIRGVDSEKDMLVCGKIKRISEDGKKIIYESKQNFQKWHLLYKMNLPHQALFTSKKYFKKYGSFDTKCKYAMDYEMVLRSYHQFPGVVKKNIVVAAWREGGIGKEHTLKVLDEYNRIRIKNNIAPYVVLKVIDYLAKVNYFLKLRM